MTAPAERYLPPPVSCAHLAQIVTRYGGMMTSRTGKIRVEYSLPVHASGEVREFLQPRSMLNLESDFLACLPGGRVFGSGNVLSADGNSIARDVSPDFGKPFEDHWLLTYPKISPPVLLRGTTAVIATTLGAGYSHWLLEELPRLLALKPDSSETLIAHATQSYNREALVLHGFLGKVLSAKRYNHHSCEQLLVPSLGRLTPTTIRALDTFTAPLHQRSSPFGERLYISRAKARRRRVANESELWAQLATHSFAKLHLEDLTWSEQINAFRGAKVIVAPHGAGLANLAFCPPGTKVIELLHHQYVNPCYWQLAAVKDLDYLPVVTSSRAPLAQTLTGNRLDIAADLKEVLQAVQC